MVLVVGPIASSSGLPFDLCIPGSGSQISPRCKTFSTLSVFVDSTRLRLLQTVVTSIKLLHFTILALAHLAVLDPITDIYFLIYDR